MSQKQIDKSAPKQEDTTKPVKPKDLSATKEKTEGDLDELLDEIDELLEENAEEFVKNYVQRGGQ